MLTKDGNMWTPKLGELPRTVASLPVLWDCVSAQPAPPRRPAGVRLRATKFLVWVRTEKTAILIRLPGVHVFLSNATPRDECLLNLTKPERIFGYRQFGPLWEGGARQQSRPEKAHALPDSTAARQGSTSKTCDSSEGSGRVNLCVLHELAPSPLL